MSQQNFGVQRGLNIIDAAGGISAITRITTYDATLLNSLPVNSLCIAPANVIGLNAGVYIKLTDTDTPTSDWTALVSESVIADTQKALPVTLTGGFNASVQEPLHNIVRTSEVSAVSFLIRLEHDESSGSDLYRVNVSLSVTGDSFSVEKLASNDSGAVVTFAVARAGSGADEVVSISVTSNISGVFEAVNADWIGSNNTDSGYTLHSDMYYISSGE